MRQISCFLQLLCRLDALDESDNCFAVFFSYDLLLNGED